MAKLMGPLFSLNAGGTLKKSLVYRNKKGTNYVSQYYKPGSKRSFVPSEAQMTQRITYGKAVQAWRALSQNEKNSYLIRAKNTGLAITGWNLFVKEYNPTPPPVGLVKIYSGATVFVDLTGACGFEGEGQAVMYGNDLYVSSNLIQFAISSSPLNGSFDFSGCSQLMIVTLANCHATAVSVAGCASLTMLDCSNNDITTLNVSGCSALTGLYCGENNISVLDISSSSVLESLFAGTNNLTTLILPQSSSLLSVDLSTNALIASQLDNLMYSCATYMQSGMVFIQGGTNDQPSTALSEYFGILTENMWSIAFN